MVIYIVSKDNTIIESKVDVVPSFTHAMNERDGKRN